MASSFRTMVLAQVLTVGPIDNEGKVFAHKLIFTQVKYVKVPGTRSFQCVPSDVSSYDLKGDSSHDSVMKRVPAFADIFDKDTMCREEIDGEPDGDGYQRTIAVYRYKTPTEIQESERQERRDEAKAVGVLNITPPANDPPAEETPKRKGR